MSTLAGICQSPRVNVSQISSPSQTEIILAQDTLELLTTYHNFRDLFQQINEVGSDYPGWVVTILRKKIGSVGRQIAAEAQTGGPDYSTPNPIQKAIRIYTATKEAISHSGKKSSSPGVLEKVGTTLEKYQGIQTLLDHLQGKISQTTKQKLDNNWAVATGRSQIHKLKLALEQTISPVAKKVLQGKSPFTPAWFTQPSPASYQTTRAQLKAFIGAKCKEGIRPKVVIIAKPPVPTPPPVITPVETEPKTRGFAASLQLTGSYGKVLAPDVKQALFSGSPQAWGGQVFGAATLDFPLPNSYRLLAQFATAGANDFGDYDYIYNDNLGSLTLARPEGNKPFSVQLGYRHYKHDRPILFRPNQNTFFVNAAVSPRLSETVALYFQSTTELSSANFEQPEDEHFRIREVAAAGVSRAGKLFSGSVNVIGGVTHDATKAKAIIQLIVGGQAQAGLRLSQIFSISAAGYGVHHDGKTFVGWWAGLGVSPSRYFSIQLSGSGESILTDEAPVNAVQANLTLAFFLGGKPTATPPPLLLRPLNWGTR